MERKGREAGKALGSNRFFFASFARFAFDVVVRWYPAT